MARSVRTEAARSSKTGSRSEPNRRAMASHSYDQFDDYEEPDGEALAAGNRSLEELRRLSAFQQVTAKVPPSYDGRSSWFAFEDAVDDWCDITELEPEKRGPALRNRLEGEAAIYKRLLDREALKNKEDGVRYFKRFLRPYFVKGAANVFLYRFQQFMNMHRGSGDMLRWMTRFQLSYQRMNESWMDTFVPLVSENDPVVRAYVLRLPQEEQQAITPEEALRRVNEQGRETHGRALPITANLIALLFVTLSDLTQDQRQVLTSLMAHKNRALTDYRVDELRTVYLEVFCTTKTTVDNPLLAPTSAPGRKSFIVIDEGTLDESQGYWCEDEDDGAEGFLDAFEDCFWVYDDESYTWFQRKFQGRKLRRGKGKGKGRKGKGKGHGGRRFFKRKKGKAHAAEDVSASDWAWNEEWHDWSYEAWTETDWQEGADDSYAAKGRKGKGKGKGKFFKGKDKKGKDGKGDHANATSEAQRTAALAGPGTPAIANAFWVQHHSFVSEAVYKQDSNEEDVPKSFLTHALSPTSMVLDIGCTRAMTSRQAAKEFMGFVDHHPDCGLWYELRPTNSHFSFANSEMAQCKEKIVIFMYDLSYTIQSTEFDIVDQGTVPFLMSLPQMRNLRFKISLEPDEALLSSSVLGMKNLPLKVARSSHLMLDLIDVAWHMWGVRFDAHKKVSFFMTNEHHFEYGYKLVTKECSPPGEESSEALVVEDEWHLDEGNHRLIRVHRKERVQSFAPSKGNTPIPLEYLDTIRETTINYKDGMKETQNDEWKDKPPVKFPKPWLGRTVFKILPGGIENRTSVKVSTRGKGPGRRGKPDDEVVKAPARKKITGKKPDSGLMPHPSRKEGSPLGEGSLRKEGSSSPEEAPLPFSPGELFGDEDEDPFPELKGKGVETTKWDDQYSPSEAPVEQPEPSPESKEDNAPEERFDPEPRRIALPLPGQEVARSSPAFRRMIEKLRSDVELYKLHVKHYHMSSAQFRRRTSMLGLPEEIYENYDRIVKSCRVCGTTVPAPPRARIAGLRAASFGDLIFVDHAEINYGEKSYITLLILDGASNLLWATALVGLEVTETLAAFRRWIEENNCVPKGVVGDQAFFADEFLAFYRFHGITPYPCGPRTPWPNRAETAVRLFKKTWAKMTKALREEGFLESITVRDAVKKVVWARNCQLTISGYSPLEIATGRRPPDLLEVETSSPEQLSALAPREDRTNQELQRIAMRAHQEARQAQDLRSDLARRVMPSDGPYVKGDKVFVWMKDESKIKSEGVWVRGKVMGQEGAMVIVHVHQAILRVNQSKIRRDHDPWHDVHIPLDMDKVPGGSPPGEEPGGLFCEYEPQCCAEHEICYHTHGGRFCDVLEIAPGPTGITACMARHGNRIGEPVHVESWQPKAIQQSIASAWKTLLHASPTLVVINPTIPDSLVRNKKAIKTYWHFCAEVVRWQDQNQGEVAVVGLTDQGFFTSQAARSLHWRIGMSSICFGQDEGATLMTNLGRDWFERLKSLRGVFMSSSTSFSPRFVVLLAECLQGTDRSDYRQESLFQDLLEDFDDGDLCSLCLRADRNSEVCSALPSTSEQSFLNAQKNQLPSALQFILPQRFVTSSLVQGLRAIEGLAPGTELEVNTSTTQEAQSLRGVLKNIRTLTLPYLEFENCNVYRGTFGKVLPVIQRHPDAVVIMWKLGDYEHVFFMNLAQLIPCLRDVAVSGWSLIVFWNEIGPPRKRRGPDVSLDFTDQPVPDAPPPTMWR